MLVRASSAFLLASFTVAAHAQVTEIVDLDNNGVQASAGSARLPSVSWDGRFVSFRASAALVPGAPLGSLYVRDRQLGTTTLVSVPVAGTPEFGSSGDSALSADGRYVAFESFDPTLVFGDTNARRDVYVRDIVLGRTARVSVGPGGAEAHGDVEAPNPTVAPSTVAISGDGRVVAFESAASDLVASDTNALPDVFVHDRIAHVTECVSIAASGLPSQGTSAFPSISADGRFVAFQSDATDLVPMLTVPGTDVYVRDRALGTTELVSVSTGGYAARRESRHPSISADGRFIAFASRASDLDPTVRAGYYAVIYVRDRLLGTTTLVTRPLPGLVHDGESRFPWISADGNWIAFTDFATMLVPGDTNAQRDVFRWSRTSGTIERMNLGPGGAQANSISLLTALSGDGSLVVYDSQASNLIANDATLIGTDVFASH